MTAGHNPLPSGVPVFFPLLAAVLQGRGKAVVLHVKSGMSPTAPPGDREGRMLPGVPARHGAPCTGHSPASPLLLWHSWHREDTEEGHWQNSGSPAARLGPSLQTLFFPSPGLTSSSSSTSMFHLKTSTEKTFSGRVRHEMKHLPPSTATARRRERARNLEGILGRRERRCFWQKASWGLPV